MERSAVCIPNYLNPRSGTAQSSTNCGFLTIQVGSQLFNRVIAHSGDPASKLPSTELKQMLDARIADTLHVGDAIVRAICR